MSITSLNRHPRLRYTVPLGAVAVVAAAVAVPQLASGTGHPPLPAKTAGQLLASLHAAKLPQFTGTVVETTNLGLPDISSDSVNAIAGSSGGDGVTQIVSLLTGSHTAQLAYGGPQRQRVALFIDDLSETDVVHNGRNVWTYSSSDNSVSHSLLPKEADKTDVTTRLPVLSSVSPRAAAEQMLRRIDPTTAVSVQRTAEVAGRAAYQLVLRPRSADSSIASVNIAIDAATSLPLRVQVWARDVTGDPALGVAFTDLHVGPPNPSTFAFTAPHGAVKKANPFSPTMVQTAPVMPGEMHGAHQAPGHMVLPKRAGGGLPMGPNVNGTSKPASLHVVGKGWTVVAEGQLPTGDSPLSSGDEAVGQVAGIVDEFGSRVAGGRLLHTNLVSALVTDSGRFYVGAVSPAYLEHLAATGGGR